MADVDPLQVVAAIGNGNLDLALVDIANALKDRTEQGKVELRWRIQFDDITIDEGECTVGEARQFEKLSGWSWEHARPLLSIDRRTHLIAATLIERQGMDVKDAYAKIDAKTALELKGCVSEYPVTSLPKDDSDPEPQES